MGILRLILALGVVRAHTYDFFKFFFFVQAGFAVILFYIISGFYMSMIIKESYSKLGPGWQKSFLLNRILRLYPAYYVVLIVSIIVMPMMGTPTIFTSQLGLTAFERGFAIFCNTFIIGLDVMVSGGRLNWHYDIPGGIPLNWQAFVVFPAWTVAVELTFYVFAAFFIMRDRMTAYFALAFAIYLRVWFVLLNGKALGFSKTGIGYSGDPFGYHFFGTNLIFFMFGYVAYEMYTYINARLKDDPGFIRWVRVLAVALGSIILFECYMFQGYVDIPDYQSWHLWVTIPFFVPFIPVIFILTKRSKIDNFIGLYSYPVYLSHVMSTYIAQNLFHFPAGKWTTLVSATIFASILVFGVEIPIDRWRHRLTFGRKSTVPEEANQLITS